MKNELSHTSDGRWGREIRAAEQKETIVTSEKDKAMAHNAIDSVASSYRKSEKDGDLFVEARFNKLCASFESALTTARREAREAERKRTLSILERLSATAAGAGAFRNRVIEEMYRAASDVEAAATKGRKIMAEPWKMKPLDEWSIVGMNHYSVDGQRRLFVAMTKDGLCIVEEGADDQYLWNRLCHKAWDATKDQQRPRPLGLPDEQVRTILEMK